MLKLPDEPFATVAINVVDDNALNEATAVPPKVTDVIPVKFIPVTVKVAPVVAEVGVKELIVGAPAI
jgi:hypothetical protein